MFDKQNVKNVQAVIGSFHPIFIEGMGGYDRRDPKCVAEKIVKILEDHWIQNPPSMPRLVMTQGDPREKNGVGAITPIVAEYFGVCRGIAYLDEEISDYHFRDADRENMIIEVKYSQLVEGIDYYQNGLFGRIEGAIDREIEKKNYRRASLGKKPLEQYFRTFALLQEVTKAACKLFCNGISIIHTSAQISEFSVSSFCTVGLELGVISSEDMINYSD